MWLRWPKITSGADDLTVLTRCAREQRTLLTLDKDFGELVFHQETPALHGVILFRTSAGSPDEFARIALAAVQSRDEWHGIFAVVGRDRIRIASSVRPPES